MEFENIINDFTKSLLSNIDSSKISNKISEEIETTLREKYGIVPKIHQIKIKDEIKTIEGTLPKYFTKILSIVASNVPIYLYGPAGSGKNYIVKKIAEALGLEFYFTNAITQEYKLSGFIDANGQFHETQFYKAFKDGGIFFLDELDASIPETLIILNAAIANKYFDFPIGKIEAHPNFRIVAAGNTFGTGANIEYTGRYNLDRATLDRFIIFPVEYDEEVELDIIPNKDLINFIHAFREAVRECGITCVCSYRTLERIRDLKHIQMPLKELLKLSLTKDLSSDDINVILNSMHIDEENPYVKALRELVNN